MKQIVLEPQRYEDIPGVSEKVQCSATVLRMHTRHGGDVRLKVSYTPEDGISRREYQGPCVAGPFAATFPLGVVIDDRGSQRLEMQANEAVGLEFAVVEGDVVEMDGRLWEIRDDVFLAYPRLYLLEG